jgi:transposase
METISKDALIVAPRQELIALITSQMTQIETLTNTITELTMKLDWFKRQIFGTKSERFLPSDDIQMALELGILNSTESDKDIPTTKVSFERKATSKPAEPIKGHGRGTMPTHLPIKDTIIEPECDITGLVKIGEEVSWYYEMDKPSSLHIVRTIRPKYGLPEKTGVLIADLPALPVEKGNAGPGLLAYIATEKYLYHMPLDRQRKKFYDEYDVRFSESWLSDNIGKVVFWFEPVYKAYIEKILRSNYLQADETPLLVLTRDLRGKTHRGYLWVYRDPISKTVIFDYRKSRSREGPSDFLKNFKGTLQVDGYEGYAEIIAKNCIKRAACMDHIRRRFEKALGYDKERAPYALDMMRIWYNLESEAREKGLSFDERLVMRREKIAPSMEAFKLWMQQQLTSVLPKSPIGIAIHYALNQWDYFDPYLTDGRVELSNILIENAIRPVALGRKNFLFAGSHDAARWPAVIYSLATIAQINGIAPFEYFKELLTELPKAKSNEIGTFLLPRNTDA